jgi:hypothetical protein
MGSGCRLLAQRYRHRRIEFTVGIGGTADMNGRVASANSVEFDPEHLMQFDQLKRREFITLLGV